MRASRWMGVSATLMLTACQQEAQGREPVKPAAPARAPSKDVSAEDYVMSPLPRGFVRLKDAFGGVHRVEVEVAATRDARTRGLMWRKELAAGKGMLFLFPYEEVQGFWMRNTLIPLDMLFISADLHIVGIVSRAEPRNLATRTVGLPSQYVLEVPGGWSESVGVTKGSSVEFEGVSGLRVEP